MASVKTETIAKAIDAPKHSVEYVRDWAPRIEQWSALYRCEQPDTTFQLADGDVTVTRRTLRMGKRIPEDWATLCWTERARVDCGEEESAEAELFDAHFGERFAARFNEYLEGNVFALGTGALEWLIDDIKLNAAGSADTAAATFRLCYVPTACILPLQWSEGRVTSVAIASVDGEMIDVRIHSGDGDVRVIENQRYRNKGTDRIERVDDAELIESGIAPRLELRRTAEPVPPMFCVLRPQIANNVDAASPFGISVFANAVDQLEAVDIVFDNFVEDVYLGRRMVGIPDTMLRKDPNSGKLLPPQQTRKNLFVTIVDPTGGGIAGDKSGIWDYSPNLRADQNEQALNVALSQLSEAVGMGAERYRYRGETIATATQIISENSTLYRNRAKHLLGITEALMTMGAALLWLARYVAGQDVDTAAEIRVVTDDSVIEDDNARQARGIAKVQAGVMSIERYLIEYEGLTEDEAVAEAARLAPTVPPLFE